MHICEKDLNSIVKQNLETLTRLRGNTLEYLSRDAAQMLLKALRRLSFLKKMESLRNNLNPIFF